MMLRLTSCSPNPQFRPRKPCLSDPTGLAPPLIWTAVPYTGLKPAGRDLGPPIPAADKAFETGSVGPLLKLLSDAVQVAANDNFKHALGKKNFSKNDIEAGREYVKAYVAFVNNVERLYEAAKNPAHGHYLKDEEAGMTAEKSAGRR